MRIMLDNNIWSYLGDERSGKRFKAIAHSLGHRVVTAPSILLEVLQHPLADKRVAIVEAITAATDERLRSEADREGAEVVAEVRRLHPEWMRSMPDTGREATWRTYWTKKFWRDAVEHHDHFRKAEPARRTARAVQCVVDNQKEQRERWNEAGFDLRDLSQIMMSPSERPRRSNGRAGETTSGSRRGGRTTRRCTGGPSRRAAGPCSPVRTLPTPTGSVPG
ncbi:hypothetical protein ACFVH9_29040 [Streptomyces hirsutus]|uniref:hypothetical protein n=1 Tax=Streptomyces hirsutus TaxID=35620 RepID=UPI003640BAC2